MPRITIIVAIAVALGGQASADQRTAARDDGRSRPQSLSAPAQPTRGLPVPLVKRQEQPVRQSERRQQVTPIPIPPPSQSTSGNARPTPARTARSNVLFVALGSLAIVLGLFFLVVWLTRRALPKSSTSLPPDVLEILGRAPLANRHHLQLMRVGKRLLLVSVTPDNAQTLAEVTDPDEVNHLAGLCRQSRPDSISATFRNVLHQLGSQTTASRRRVEPAVSELDLNTAAEPGRG